LFGALFRALFAGFTGIGCQNDDDAERLRKLGCRPEAIHVVGNLKFDAAKLEERRVLDVPGLLRQLGFSPSTKLLVGGSTHAGEEAILGDIYMRLRKEFPDLRLIMVPRHFERGKEVGRELSGRGVKFAFRSSLTAHTQYEPGELDCLLVNTTGELRYFYEHAAVIFVGKSLTAEGGQNPIEPGALGKPLVFGPNMQNFEAVAKAFVGGGGALQVQNAEELERTIVELLRNPARAAELGKNAVAVVRENSGAIERTVDMMVNYLDDGEMYVAKGPAKVR